MISRAPAVQISPWLRNVDEIAPRSAASRSASARTMLADLPPSSSVSRFMLAAARRWISWPAAVEPVNESASTSGCSASADPASASPVTTFKTPAGIPASSASSASRKRRHRRLRGGLVDDGVAAGEGRGDLPRGDREREVPRGDDRTDAERLADRVREDARGGRVGRAEDLGRPAGVVGPRRDGERQVAGRCLGERLADVAALDLGQFIGIALDQLRQRVEQPRPARRVERGPGRLCLTGRRDRRIHVGLRAERAFRERLARGRIARREAPAVARREGAATDEVAQHGTRRAGCTPYHNARYCPSCSHWCQAGGKRDDARAGPA